MAAGTAKITLNTYSFPDGYVTGSGGNVEPPSGSGVGTTTGKIAVYYDQLDFTPSSADSYKSTSGDVFKVYVDGVRIYRRDDQNYSSGYDFMEPGDNADGTLLAGLRGYNPAVTQAQVDGGTSITNAVSWNSTTNEVWTIDTTNSKILIDIEEILATDLYGSNGKALTFSTSNTVIELRRAVQELRSPSVDFSNASILTEQDLDNSSKNVFHVAQQASADVDSAMKFSETTDSFEAYEPGTETIKKITGVKTGTATNDAVNFGQFTDHDNTIIGYRDTTLAYKEDTEDYKLEAGDWAQRTGSQVKVYTDNNRTGSDLGYSAKEHAIGTTVPEGSAKDWATQDTTAVASSLFSAKEYASGSNATGGTAKEWAQKSDGAVDTEFSAKAYASVTGSNAPTDGSAKEWATTTGGAVASSEHSAKSYAMETGSTAPSSGSAKEWATVTGAQIDSDYSAKEYAIGTTATSAKSYATTTGSAVTGSDYSAKEWALGDLTTTGGSAKAWATDSSSPDGSSLKSAKSYAADALTHLNDFKGQYFGPHATDSAVATYASNNSYTIGEGDLYFDTTNKKVKAYNGTSWQNATSSTEGVVATAEYTGNNSTQHYALTHDQGMEIVYLNGVKLLAGDASNNNDYFSVSGGSSTTYVGDNGVGTHIYFHTAPGTGDLVSIIAWGESDNTLAVPKSGGTFTGAITGTDLTLSGNLTVSGTTTTIDTTVESVDKLEVGANSGDHAVSVSQSGAGAGIKVNVTGTGNLLQLQDNGTDKFVVKDGGNVGINVAPSKGELHIKGSSTGTLAIDSAAGSEQAIRFCENGTVEGRVAYRTDTSPERMEFYVGGEASGDRRLVIDDSGKVGIGATAPERFLHTKGAGEVQALFENPSTSNSQFAYVDIESNASANGEAILRFKTPDGTSYINSKGSATTMTFSSGNVGIGCSPSTTAKQHNQRSSTATYSAGTGTGELQLLLDNVSATTNTRYAGLQLAQGGTGVVNLLAVTNSGSKSDLVVQQYHGSAYRENLRVHSNGDVKINDGNLVIGTAGKGIDFSVNSHASGMTSELLDSYEEGTFTPTLLGASNSTQFSYQTNGQSGTYTKIGRMVQVNIYVGINSTSGPTGQVAVGNLPFSVADTLANTGLEASGSVAYWANTSTSTSGLWIAAEDGSSQARIYFVDGTANTTMAELQPSDLSSTFNVRATLTYFTT